ncbi:STAS domain-containing protein [Streptomyces yangpuensis]|uniref:STAS domain-containing protein n=1 Tax=Streptomyces yangpuensis TaxID=1648182 RepID=UPI00362D25B4
MTRTWGGHATADALRERVTALTLGPGHCLVVDLAGLEFCDSSGLTPCSWPATTPMPPGQPSS